MENKLPEGWEWKKLREVSTIGAGNGAPQGDQYFENGEYPFVRTSDVGKDGQNICLKSPRDKVNDFAITECKLKLWPQKTLLIPKSGASTFLNHRALLGESAYVSSHLATIIPKDSILPEYLYYWSLILDAKSLTPNTNYPSLKLSDIETAKIPVPPLETQQKIVSILVKAEETKKLRAQADELTQKFLQSVFLEMFGDPAENSNGLKMISLENACSEIYRYPTFYGFDYIETGVPIVRIGNILADGSLDPNESNYVFFDPDLNKKFPRTILELNDVVMAVRGDGSTAKRIGLVNNPNVIGANISPNLIRIKANKDILNPIYLFYFLTSEYGQLVLQQSITRTAKKTITAENIKKVAVPCPPIENQNKFAEIAKQVEKTKQSQQQSSLKINTLFDALMKKAFTGELVA